MENEPTKLGDKKPTKIKLFTENKFKYVQKKRN